MMGDFNLPSITWTDIGAKVVSPPTYGSEVNNTFVDMVNDFGFEQFVDSPTRQGNTLDLVFSAYQNITNLNVTPGMSDHVAITFCINATHELSQNKAENKSPFYYKANITSIKNDLLEFKNSFIESDPLARSLEQNWLDFKAIISEMVPKHVPHKTVWSHNHLPWINRQIKRDMKVCKCLYN